MTDILHSDYLCHPYKEIFTISAAADGIFEAIGCRPNMCELCRSTRRLNIGLVRIGLGDLLLPKSREALLPKSREAFLRNNSAVRNAVQCCSLCFPHDKISEEGSRDGRDDFIDERQSSILEPPPKRHTIAETFAASSPSQTYSAFKSPSKVKNEHWLEFRNSWPKGFSKPLQGGHRAVRRNDPLQNLMSIELN